MLIKNSEEQGFECKLPTIKKAQGGDEPAFVRPLKETRRPKKAEDLPVSASPMQILGGGKQLVKASKQCTTIYVGEPTGSVGYYNLPPSLRTQLRQHLRLNGAEDELDGQLLAGFHIVHTDEFKGRVSVRGGANSKSYEEKMCICDRSGHQVAKTEPRKRERDE